MSLFIKIYFTSFMLNMFRTLIHPSSGACDFSIVAPHWSCVLVSMCVGVSVWLGWGGICVEGFLLHGYTIVFTSIQFYSIFYHMLYDVFVMARLSLCHVSIRCFVWF